MLTSASVFHYSHSLYSPTCGADLPVGCELVLTPSSESVHEDDGDFLIYGNETDTARDVSIVS